MAAAERAGANLAASGRYNAEALRDVIIRQLEAQARTIAELTSRLAVLARADDPEIANLLSSARLAIEEGRLEEADRFLAMSEESDLAAIAVAEARGERARSRLAQSIFLGNGLDRTIQSSELSAIRDAALRYRRALSVSDRDLAPGEWARIQFNLAIAQALLVQAGDTTARDAAIASFESAAQGYQRVGDGQAAVQARELADALRAR